MNFLKNLKVSMKLFIGFGFLLVFFGLAVYFGSSGLAQITTAADEVAERYDQILQMWDLKNMNTELTLLFMDIIIDKESGKIEQERLDWLKDFKDELDGDEKASLAATDTEEEKKHVLEIFTSFRKMIKTAEEEMFPAVTSKYEDASFWHRMDDFFDQEGEKATTAIELNIKSIREELNEAHEKEIMANKAANRNMVLVLAIGLIFSLAVVFTIRGSILTPVKLMVDRAKKLTQGDLISTFEIDQKDEMGDLAQTLKKTIMKLNEVVSEVLMASDYVASGAQQMASSAQEMSQGATEQASSAEEVSSSMEEMGANIQQNTDNAQTTEKMAIKAAQDAKESGEAVTEAVGAMKDIADKISIIQEIARQTNLLALNAAIEAARAGEAGKGFAVVASEVRKLAERSQAAAGDITELASKTVTVAENAGGLLQKLVPDIQKTADLVQEIAASSNEQNSGAGQINKALGQLEQVIQQNAGATEEIASTAEELSSQADMLKGTMAFFQIDTSQHDKQNKMALGAAKKSARPSVAHLKPAQPKASTQDSRKTKPTANGGVDLDLGDGDNEDKEFERF